jgi:hypothetical protein
MVAKRSSGKSSSGPKNAKDTADGEGEGKDNGGGNKKSSRKADKPLSAAMIEAASHVKDFMTDNQKALAYLKVGKILFGE